MDTEGCALLYWDNFQGKSPGIFMRYYRGGPLGPTHQTPYGVYWESDYIAPFSAGMVWNHNLRLFHILLNKSQRSPNVKDIGINLEASCSSYLPLAQWHADAPMYGSLINLDGQITASVTNATQDDNVTKDRSKLWAFGMARLARDQLQPLISPLAYDDDTTKAVRTHQWAFARVQKGEVPTNTTLNVQRGHSQLVGLPYSTKMYGLKRTGDKSLTISTMPVSAFSNVLLSPDFRFADFVLDLAPTFTQAATMIAVQGTDPNTAPQLHVFWVDQPSDPRAAPGTGDEGGICSASIALRDINSGVYGEIATQPGQWSAKPAVTRLGIAATTNRLAVMRVNQWIALYFNTAGKIMVTYTAVTPDGRLTEPWGTPTQRATGSLLAVCPLPLSVIPIPPEGQGA